MTDPCRKNVSAVAVLLVSASIMLSCKNIPEEGEIVITAADLASAQGDSPGCRIPDTLAELPADSLALPGDGAFLADDSLAAPPDSLAGDSLTLPGECPWNILAVEIHGSIYSSLEGTCDEPDILGAHLVRIMWWDTDPWNGMCAGDSIYAVWGEGATGRENLVLAMRYVPVAGNSTPGFSAYNFTRTGDNYPSYYYGDGAEVTRLLDVMPIGTFEEMTGPFGEPRGDHAHAGVDFKAPEGTPVRTCRGGTVVRTNWNQSYNGNCVEIRFGGGYSEVFLHLSSIASGIVPGVILVPGDEVGAVGSTGMTSTNAHLHYQINDADGNPIDPYVFCPSHRRSLPAGDMEAFAELRERCDAWMATGSAP